MLRGIIHGSESGLGNFTVDFALAALFWDRGDNSEKLRHVFRYDARVQGRSQPSLLSANYGGLHQFNDAWHGQIAILNGRAFGGSSDHDI